MREYNDALDALCFTEEEQAMLTKKLCLLYTSPSPRD